MVSFYANVYYAKSRAYFFGLLIGREEREVPDVAGGKVALHIPFSPHILGEFVFTVISTGALLCNHLYAKKQSHGALYDPCASRSSPVTHNVACFCSQGPPHRGNRGWE